MKKKTIINEHQVLDNDDFFDAMKVRSESLEDVPLEKIRIRSNIRKEYNGIEEMANSIQEKGIQQPIVLTPTEDGYFEIIFGHRRYKGMCLLNEKHPDQYMTIKAVVKDKDAFDEDELVEVQIIENIQRDNLSFHELRNALTQLKEKGLTQKEIAYKLGKSLGYVKNIFTSINALDENKELNSLVESHAGVTSTDILELRPLPYKEQVALIKEKIDGSISSRAELRERVKKLRESLTTTNQLTHQKKLIFDVFSEKKGVYKVRSFTYDPTKAKKEDTETLLSNLKALIKIIEEAVK